MSKALVVDDYIVLLEGIADMVSSHPSIHKVDKANNPLNALESLKHTKYDLLISDYSMPEMNGAELVKLSKEISPEIKVIILSLHDQPFIVNELLALEINGYVLKKNMVHDLPMAISNVLKGNNYFSPDIEKLREEFGQTKSPNALSTREFQILALMAQNFNNQQIADQLQMNCRTIDLHEKNMMRKTQSKGRIELIKATYNQYDQLNQ